MIETALRIHNRDLKDALLPRLTNRVFHVTTGRAVFQVMSDGVIRANADGRFSFTFGQSENSYFRKRNCVSVFDLRARTPEQIEDSLGKYYFLNPSFAENRPVYLFLNASCFDKLVPWTKWKEERAWREMIVPYVEAGYPGDLEFNLIDEVLRLDIDHPLSYLEIALRRSGQENAH